MKSVVSDEKFSGDNAFSVLKGGDQTLEKHSTRTKKRLGKWYWTIVGSIMLVMVSLQPVFAADTIWTRFSDIMRDVYSQLLGVSTIVAVTVAAIALIVRMISRNQRAVDEATSWLKRIVITCIVLNSLGFIIAYLQPLVAGGQYIP